MVLAAAAVVVLSVALIRGDVSSACAGDSLVDSGRGILTLFAGGRKEGKI